MSHDGCIDRVPPAKVYNGGEGDVEEGGVELVGSNLIVDVVEGLGSILGSEQGGAVDVVDGGRIFAHVNAVVVVEAGIGSYGLAG